MRLSNATSPPMRGAREADRPRILLVTPQPYFEERGTPIAVGLVARALVESGFAVDLLAFPLGESRAAPGVRIERCGNPFRIRQVRIGFSMRKLVLDASLLRAFEKLLVRRQYVAVHAVEEAAWLASVLCPIHRVPFVYDMASAIPQQLAGHWLLGREPFRSMLRGTEKRVIERAAHVVCSGGLAGYVRGQAAEAAVTEWRFPVSGEGASASEAAALREQQNIAPDDHVLLYAGNFSSYQGIDLLLESFARAAASNPRLLLVCVGATDQQDAQRLTAPIPEGLRQRLRVLPRQPRALMPAWLAAADCLVSLRTMGDNVPLKLFEYMAADRPIIATVGPAHQPLLNEARAYLCAADVDGVADAMHQVFADPERARRVAARAAAYAGRNFSWSRFRELVAGIYDEVLQPASLPAPEPAPVRRAR